MLLINALLQNRSFSLLLLLTLTHSSSLRLYSKYFLVKRTDFYLNSASLQGMQQRLFHLLPAAENEGFFF